MPIRKNVLIGITLVLMLSLAVTFANRPQPAPVVRQFATALEPHSSVASVEQPSKPVDVPAAVSDLPIDPPLASEPDKPAGDEAVPLDLSDRCNFKASDFDRVKQYPWPAVPRGSQTFAGVPLEISGAINLWGERNAKNGLIFPEQFQGIPIQRQFEALYVCHGAFFEGGRGLPMYEIVFNYDDATSASDTIVCGIDVRDWYANRKEVTFGPSGPRSTLAWDCDAPLGDRTQTIRFCLTEVANPHPDKGVTTIDLVSSKTQTASCILAITTGKSGLMKRTEETQSNRASGATGSVR